MSKYHLAVAVFSRPVDAGIVTGSFHPFVLAACDGPGQTEHVQLSTAPLVRALPNGWLVDVRTGEHVEAGDVCRNCLKAEAR